MFSVGMAVISDRVSVHLAQNILPYLVGPTTVSGTPGPPGNLAAPSLSSGSIDVFVEGRSVHRQYDASGVVHTTQANPVVDNVVGVYPANMLLGLGTTSVWRLHPQPWLMDGSSDVFTNGVRSGYHGARYFCSAVVEGRFFGIPTVFVTPKFGGVAALVSATIVVAQVAADKLLEREDN